MSFLRYSVFLLQYTWAAHILHIPIPYVMGYDMQPLVTLNEKELFLQEAVQKNYTLFFEHDPKNECCDLQITEKGIRAKETFTLNHWLNA